MHRRLKETNLYHVKTFNKNNTNSLAHHIIIIIMAMSAFAISIILYASEFL